MLITERTFSSDDYRYGFQGQEKDDEIKGEGNSLNYTFRMHDPRVGRFFAVDPLAQDYPELTPYQFSGNNTTWMREYEGLEGLVSTGMPMGNSGFGHGMIVSPEMAAKSPPAAKSTAMDITPFLGTGKGFLEAYTGKDAVTGEKIPGWSRTLNLIPLVKPLTKLVKAYKTANAINQINKLKPCGCFTAGTQVYTENGYKNIEDIKIGDKVWAYNDTTAVLELKKVTNTFTRDFNQVYKIYFGNEVLSATYEHPFFIGGKWFKVEELQVGDSLTLYDGTTISISKIEILEGNFKVYNFIVDEFHTYYVSKQNVLVHNGNPCTFISKKIVANLPSIGVVAKQAKNLQPDGKTLNFVIDDNLIKVNGKPYTGAKDFVITENGALMLGNGHYHLSGNAAKVKGAGEVNIVNGKIQDVTNNSGHYQPTKESLVEMVDVFKKEKIATDDIVPTVRPLPNITKQ